MKSKPKPSFDPKAFLSKVGIGRSSQSCKSGEVVFAQGEPADSLFYIQKGKVKLAVVSSQGKEAVVAILDPGAFFGEGCLAGQKIRMSTASAMSDCSLMRVKKASMVRSLLDQPAFADLFLRYVLSRNI